MVSKTGATASAPRSRSFADQSTVARVIGVLIAPAALGIVSGLVLGVSEPVYWVVQVVAIVGGFFGGTEHAGWRPGLLRGLISGAVFGAAILAVRALTGWSDKADIGHPAGLLVIVTAVAGAVLAALGGARGPRRRRR
jgi:hypothetical protein